jgi:hypothetical protein
MSTAMLQSATPFASEPPAARSRQPGLATLAIGTALLSLAPTLVLGTAIGWPASLGKPAAEQLAAIAAAPQAVAAGYGLYLLYSLLVAPLMIGLAARTFGHLAGALAATVAVFAGLSVLARAVGILRWLTVMPELAAAHGQAEAAQRAQIELLFQALTRYGGGIGELLGVSLFMAIAVGVLCGGAWLRRAMPAWLAALGLLTAVLLFGLFAPVVGAPLRVSPVISVTALSVWMLAAGVWCLRRG